MFVEELILDGFKSYATRTVISGWDPEFNAITGLNGSGKSNILDSICFVLGIQVLSNLRASSLQDLVYKKGQAGVTKATVSIVFNNDDRSKSPLGYEENKKITVTRQVVVGGKNKYLINGVTVPQQRVFDLFQSVSLNVNNPHFLIMQGKITKVLNMKPPEILAMIEEASGTRMFEERKEKALKTMAKKELKVNEIVQVLEEVVNPKLNKLREQKRAYLEFQKLSKELEELTQFLVGHEYYKNQELAERSEHCLTEAKSNILGSEEQIEILNRDISSIQAAMDDIMQSKFQTKLNQLELAYAEASKELVQTKTLTDLRKKTLSEEEANYQTLIKTKQELIAHLEKLKAEIKNFDFEQESKDYQSKVEELKKNEELLQSLSMGVSTDGQDGGYMHLLQEAKNKIANATSESEQLKIRQAFLKKQAKTLEPKVKKAQKLSESLLKDIEQSRLAVEDVKQKISQIPTELPNEEEKRQEQYELQRQANELQETISKLELELAPYQFQYSDPSPDFDRSQVKGLVAELIELPSKNVKYTTALEVTAGGKLYNVIVDNEKVGSSLLNHGKLRKRVTIIPLNKINAFKVQVEKIAKSISISNQKADIALSLIGYDEQVSAAMDYVFGSTLICQDAQTAKNVTFHPEVRLRSVTIEGDIYDPSGSLSGGSRPNSAGILTKMTLLKEAKNQLRLIDEQLCKLNKVLDDFDQSADKLAHLEQELQLKQHQLSLLEEQLANHPNARLIQQYEEEAQELKDIEQSLLQLEKDREAAYKEQEKIEKEMSECSHSKESKMKEIKSTIQSLKKYIAQKEPQMTQKKREFQIAQEEIKQGEKDIDDLDQEMRTLSDHLKTLQSEYKDMNTLMIQKKKIFDDAEKQLEKEKTSLQAVDHEIRSLEKQKSQKKQLIEDLKLSIQKQTHELKQLEADQSNAKHRLKELLKSHEWIRDSQHLFNQPGSLYDFKSANISEQKERQSQLKERHTALKKRVNQDVLENFDRIEKKEASLKQKLATVHKDKKKIESTISELEKYKKETLLKTWEKVNVDFGAIFGDLLPGNSAKLEPPEGMELTEGLEVKVCLGGVWKQSLTELSGGQRSLIALSLILSLLQFRPAPMYILDEIDAALDLSHTQNIGQLFKTRFRDSQFIVVSLKEGMFTNANVLFKARFRDGVSTVERHVQKSRDTPATPLHKTKKSKDRRQSVGMSLAARRMSLAGALNE